nr:hypothetical protein CFP56_23652 [Quercus suber]
MRACSSLTAASPSISFDTSSSESDSTSIWLEKSRTGTKNLSHTFILKGDLGRGGFSPKPDGSPSLKLAW